MPASHSAHSAIIFYAVGKGFLERPNDNRRKELVPARFDFWLEKIEENVLMKGYWSFTYIGNVRAEILCTNRTLVNIKNNETNRKTHIIRSTSSYSLTFSIFST